MPHDILSLLRQAGPLDLITLATLCVSLLWGAALGLAHGGSRRVPAPLWLLGPAALIALVPLLCMLDLIELNSAMRFAAYELRAKMQVSGLSQAAYHGSLALLAAAVSAAWTGLALAIASSFGPRPGATWTPTHSIAPLLGWALAVVLLGVRITRLPLDASNADALCVLLALGALPLLVPSLRVGEREQDSARDAGARGVAATLGLTFGLCITAALPGLVLERIVYRIDTLTPAALLHMDDALVAAMVVGALASLLLGAGLIAASIPTLRKLRVGGVGVAMCLLIGLAAASAVAAAVHQHQEQAKLIGANVSALYGCEGLSLGLGLDAGPVAGDRFARFEGDGRAAWGSLDGSAGGVCATSFGLPQCDSPRDRTALICDDGSLLAVELARVVGPRQLSLGALVGRQQERPAALLGAVERAALRGVPLLISGVEAWRATEDGQALIEARDQNGRDALSVIRHVVVDEQLWSAGEKHPLTFESRAEGEIVAVVATPDLQLKDALLRCHRLRASQCVLLPAVPPGFMPTLAKTELGAGLLDELLKSTDGGFGLGDAPGDPGQLGKIGQGGTIGKGLPRVKLDGDHTELGGMRDLVRRVIKRQQRQVRACYEQALARDPEARGKVTIKFAIDLKGDVSQATITEDTLSDPEVGRCVQGVIRSLKFPTPTGGPIIINYPFVFQPG
jgi:hypothetical protein